MHCCQKTRGHKAATSDRQTDPELGQRFRKDQAPNRFCAKHYAGRTEQYRLRERCQCFALAVTEAVIGIGGTLCITHPDKRGKGRQRVHQSIRSRG